ncbi:MAG: thioredoxin domain-containing protein [Microbacterium sp.]
MAAQKKLNLFPIVVSGIVVLAVVVLVVVLVWMKGMANANAEGPDSDIVAADTGAITFGSGDTTVDTYVDFMCPNCGAFEQAYGAALQSTAEEGDLTLNIHPVAILDAASQGTEFSTRAANAMYCVAESNPDAALDFFNAMYANQPEENSTGLTDDEIIQYATDAGADGAASCITDQTYADYVTAQTKAMPAQTDGTHGTPTIAIDGEVIDLSEVAARFEKILSSDSE